MATYKYQQNFFEGSSVGYVQYNINPGFDTRFSVGETFEIVGKAYSKDLKRYGIVVEVSPDNGNGSYEIGHVVKTISKGGSATFSITCTITERLANAGGARGFTGKISFMLMDTSDFSSGASTVASDAQKLNIIQYRINPVIDGISFLDKTGAFDHFGGMVQSKSDLTAVLDAELDPLDPALYVDNVQISMGENVIEITRDNIAGTEAYIGKVDFTGEFDGYTVLVTDSKGLATTKTFGRLSVFPYQAPKLYALTGIDVAERYTLVYDDAGIASEVTSDSGEYLWISFGAETAPVNGKNAWNITCRYAERGYALANDKVIFSGEDGSEVSAYKDQNIIPRINRFNANTRYTVQLEIKDFFQSLILSFDVDKAGGYFNIEKHGVAAGMRSTATQSSPKFESAHPIYAYAGIEGVTNYTTEEVKTGGTWIDGKPIYRKILTLNVPKTNTWYVSANDDMLTDVDTVVKYDFIGDTSTRVVNADSFYSTSAYTRAYIERQSTKSDIKLVYWTNDSVMLGTARAIVCYTKTTDGISDDWLGYEYTRPASAMTSNSSAGCVVTASSEYSSNFAAWKAFNKSNSDSYCWATAYEDTNRWIQIKLDIPLNHVTVTITNRNHGSLVNGIIDGEILGSGDGSEWRTLCTITGRDGATSGLSTTHYCDVDGTFEYFRIKANKVYNDTNVSIGEISIKGYGEAE